MYNVESSTTLVNAKSTRLAYGLESIGSLQHRYAPLNFKPLKSRFWSYACPKKDPYIDVLDYALADHFSVPRTCAGSGLCLASICVARKFYFSHFITVVEADTTSCECTVYLPVLEYITGTNRTFLTVPYWVMGFRISVGGTFLMSHARTTNNSTPSTVSAVLVLEYGTPVPGRMRLHDAD